MKNECKRLYEMAKRHDLFIQLNEKGECGANMLGLVCNP